MPYAYVKATLLETILLNTQNFNLACLLTFLQMKIITMLLTSCSESLYMSLHLHNFYHIKHLLLGFIGDPLWQFQAWAKSWELAKVPCTRNLCGLWGSDRTSWSRDSLVADSHHTYMGKTINQVKRYNSNICPNSIKESHCPTFPETFLL